MGPPLENFPSVGGRRAHSLRAVSDPVVRLREVVSLIGRFPALAGADLTVEPGEVVLLQGPNGAGKSTLLRLCAGLAPVHTGTAQVFGFDVGDRRGQREVRRRVGLLGHATSLYDDLTVEENVRFWAAAGGDGSGAGARADEAMGMLGVGDRLRTVRVAGLSAGQRRRTAIAVVVARRPQLWLLDEPHAGLDADGRDWGDGLVRHAVDQGATAMVASHEHDRVDALATRVVSVVGGQVTGAKRS